MKKTLAALAILTLIVSGIYLFQEQTIRHHLIQLGNILELQKQQIKLSKFQSQSQKRVVHRRPKTADQIYKNSPAVCQIYSKFTIQGENSLNQPVTAVLQRNGSCFLVEFNKTRRVITNAHLVQMNKAEALLGINSSLSLIGSWKEISEVRLAEVYLIFKNAGDNNLLAKNVSEVRNLIDESDPKILKAALKKVDENLDLAALVLKNPAAYKKLKAWRLGDSNQLKIGSKAYTIGNPLGHSFVFLSGEISHFHTETKDGKIYRFIYTSEMAGPGSSGSPLFNEKGKVMGICNRTYLINPHFGIFIPANTIKEFLESK